MLRLRLPDYNIHETDALKGEQAMISRRTLLKLSASCAAGIAMPTILKAQPPVIRIGEINSYTPPISVYTIPYRKGWTLALEEINNQGGINGRAIEVISRNDHGKIDDSARIAQYLIERDKVSLLFGSYLSNIGLAIAEQANTYKIPFIAAEPLSDELTLEKGNPYTFRVRPSTYMQTNMLAKEASRLPVSRWACVAPDYEYGRSAVKNFQQFMSARRPDIEWVHEEWVPLFRHNPSQTIDALRAARINAIFNVTFSSDLESFVQEGARQNFFNGKSVVSMLSGEPEYLNTLTSPVCDGWLVTGYPWDQIAMTAHHTFVENYKNRFEEKPVLGSLVGYTTMQAIGQAYSETRNDSSIALITTLRDMRFRSPLGMLHFRKNDQQSSMGAFVGRLNHIDGKNVMSNWYYANGTDYWPAANIVKARRPDFPDI